MLQRIIDKKFKKILENKIIRKMIGEPKLDKTNSA